MSNTHDQFEPKLRVRASGYGGSGYAIPTESGEVLKVPGVTTVLDALPKGGVTQWAVDNTVSYMLANLDRILTESEEDDVLFRRYRFYHQRKPKVDDPETNPYNYHVGVLSDLAEVGTLVHDWIATHVLELFEPELHKDMQVEAVEAFLEWMAEHEVEPVNVEVTVVNETIGYAGTLDHIWNIKCTHDGDECLPGSKDKPVLSLVDVKTSKRVYESHIAQQSAIKNAEYMLVETTKDEPGALKHTTKKWGTTYWSKQELPEVQHVAILQTRYEDFDTKTGEIEPQYAKLHYLRPESLDIGWKLFTSSLDMKKALKDWKDYEGSY